MLFERIKKPREEDSYLDLDDYSSELEKGFNKVSTNLINGSGGGLQGSA